MRLEPTTFMPVTPSMRLRIEATIDHLVSLLDAIDGDPDLEPANDDEPSLGWTSAGGTAWRDAGDDREADF